MYDSAVDADLDLPLIRRLAAHRFTPAQLVAIDAVVVAVIIVAMHVVMPGPPSRLTGAGWEIAGWAAYIVAAVAVLFRRRFPRTALAVVLPIVVAAMGLRAGFGMPFYAAIALYSVVSVSARRTGLILVSGAAAVVLAADIIGGGNSVAPAGIGGVTVLLLGWLAGESAQASRVYARQQRERAAEKAAGVAAAQAEQLSQALAQERAQIARELHDIVAHAMSVIAVRSGVARMVIDTDPQQAREALAIIETTTRRSLQEMRLLVSVLRDPRGHDPELSPVPGLADLDRLLADTAAAGVAVDLRIDGDARPLPPAADLSAYRIVQEALTNVVRHAGPTHALVRISYGAGGLGLEVTDAGPAGAPPAARHGSGHGLIGMRERVALFGGELSAGPHADGFRVRASLPAVELQAGDLTVGHLTASEGAR